MQSEQNAEHSSEPLLQPGEQQELLALVERILASGALGKSRVYGRILQYLADCTVQGLAPKETSIAIDVLERSIDFDMSRDSIVRVHMFQLRSKLEKYFRDHGAEEHLHLAIPKGQYGLAITRTTAEPDDAAGTGVDAPAPGPVQARAVVAAWWRKPLLWFGAGLTMALLVLYAMSTPSPPAAAPDSMATSSDSLRTYGLWDSMFDDNMEVLLVVGDYYIFGERDEHGAIGRMVREFDIGSQRDFDRRASRDEAFSARHADLGMSYIPTGIAPALARLMPVLSSRDKKVRVKLVSELQAADLVSYHILYVGLFSGLADLQDLMFASSGLFIGSTYDELHGIENDAYYLGRYRDPAGGDGFRDYGMLSAFEAPRGNQFIMLTGMRDAGLLNVVEQATSTDSLEVLRQALMQDASDMAAFEALYEVTGLEATRFATRLRYSQVLDSAVIWEARLVRGDTAP